MNKLNVLVYLFLVLRMTDVSYGSFILTLQQFVEASNSFTAALAHQLQQRLYLRPHKTTRIEATERWFEERFSIIAKKKDLYPITPVCHRNSLLMRGIITKMQIGVTIYCVDGAKTTYPYRYQLNEPMLQLYLDGCQYSSVINIRIGPPREVPPFSHLRLGTWNTQGGRSKDRRSLIDAECLQRGLDIVCIQDARVQIPSFDSANYLWLTTYDRFIDSEGCGTVSGFLVRHGLHVTIKHEIIAGNLQVLHVRYEECSLIILNYYMPCEGKPGADQSFIALNNTIKQLCIQYPGYVKIYCGDSNSHLGSDIAGPPQTGPYLYHKESNANGVSLDSLMKLNNLASCTTLLDSSTLVTWTRCRSDLPNDIGKSQLDHVLIRYEHLHCITWMKGSWGMISDHKLITFEIRLPATRSDIGIGVTLRPARDYSNKRPYYDLTRLKNQTIIRKMCHELDQLLRPLIINASADLDQLWSVALQGVHMVLQSFLGKRQGRVSQKEGQESLLAKLREVRHMRLIDRDSIYAEASDQPSIRNDQAAVQAVYQNRERAHYQAREKETLQALSTIEATASDFGKLNQAFKLFRYLKRRKAKHGIKSLPMSTLLAEMGKWDAGVVPTLPSDESRSIISPSTTTLQAIMDRMRKGTAAGLDNLSLEVISGVPVIRDWIFALIREAYGRGKVPEAWRETFITLLPKKPKPKGFDDYRPITIATVPYRIYAHNLLLELQEHLPVLNEYQNGFVRGRSVDDTLYCLNQVMDAYWTRNQPLYIISIDLLKAFSTVNIHKLPSLLDAKEVPRSLVNRIIDACLAEKTSIYHHGERSAFYTKTVGVKQGCPISPMIFNIVLDAAVTSAQQKIYETDPSLDLYLGEAEADLKLPMILSYADDMNLLVHYPAQIDTILTHLVAELREYGLNVNATKSSILLRTPDECLREAFKESEYKLYGGLQLPVTQKLKVLGSYIVNDVKRRSQSIDRCGLAKRIYYTMITTFEPMKLPFSILLRLYRAIIVPALIHGQKSTAMTIENKRMFMKVEIDIVRGLARIAHPRPRNQTIFEVLKGKTITRVIIARKISYHGHVLRRNKDSILQKARKFALAPYKRKRGRPIHLFETNLLKHLNAIVNVSTEDWKEAFAHGAESTKRLTKNLYLLDRYGLDPLKADVLLFPEVSI